MLCPNNELEAAAEQAKGSAEAGPGGAGAGEEHHKEAATRQQTGGRSGIVFWRHGDQVLIHSLFRGIRYLERERQRGLCFH